MQWRPRESNDAHRASHSRCRARRKSPVRTQLAGGMPSTIPGAMYVDSSAESTLTLDSNSSKKGLRRHTTAGKPQPHSSARSAKGSRRPTDVVLNSAISSCPGAVRVDYSSIAQSPIDERSARKGLRRHTDANVSPATATRLGAVPASAQSAGAVAYNSVLTRMRPDTTRNSPSAASFHEDSSSLGVHLVGSSTTTANGHSHKGRAARSLCPATRVSSITAAISLDSRTQAKGLTRESLHSLNTKSALHGRSRGRSPALSNIAGAIHVQIPTTAGASGPSKHGLNRKNQEELHQKQAIGAAYSGARAYGEQGVDTGKSKRNDAGMLPHKVYHGSSESNLMLPTQNTIPDSPIDEEASLFSKQQEASMRNIGLVEARKVLSEPQVSTEANELDLAAEEAKHQKHRVKLATSLGYLFVGAVAFILFALIWEVSCQATRK